MKMTPSEFVQVAAKQLGFDFTGIARAGFMEAEARRLEDWLKLGLHGQMHYMEKYFDLRTDPRLLLEGAKSVIVLTYNYYTPEKPADPGAPVIATYAYGTDYHTVIRNKLHELLQIIRSEIGEVNGRCFVDSGPVLERDWARRSGLGWTGKNTLTIHPRQGSFFFLATLIVDIELDTTDPIRDHCGTCTRCIDACPTEAISPGGYLLDASKCISYLTIELKEAIPEAFRGKLENRLFGCDICQDICPWNRFSRRHTEPEFEPLPGLLDMTRKDWEEMTEEVFKQVFRKSPLRRPKYEGIRRNLQFLK